MSVFPIPYGEKVGYKKYDAKASVDEYNRPKSGYRPTVEIEGVGVDAPSSTDIENGTVQRADADYWLFLPAGTSYDSRDRFIVRGHECTVVGVADPLHNFFTGSLFRTEVHVRRTDG